MKFKIASQRNSLPAGGRTVRANSNPLFSSDAAFTKGFPPALPVVRLKKAAILFTEGIYNINEIAEKVGYTSATHFGRNFQKQFGMTASEFIKRKEGA